jgi:hypothetical protein
MAKELRAKFYPHVGHTKGNRIRNDMEEED